MEQNLHLAPGAFIDHFSILIPILVRCQLSDQDSILFQGHYERAGENDGINAAKSINTGSTVRRPRTYVESVVRVIFIPMTNPVRI